MDLKFAQPAISDDSRTAKFGVGLYAVLAMTENRLLSPYGCSSRAVDSSRTVQCGHNHLSHSTSLRITSYVSHRRVLFKYMTIRNCLRLRGAASGNSLFMQSQRCFSNSTARHSSTLRKVEPKMSKAEMHELSLKKWWSSYSRQKRDHYTPKDANPAPFLEAHETPRMAPPPFPPQSS